jgi:hypothetical protein
MNQSRVRKCIGWLAIAAAGAAPVALHAQERDSVPTGPAPILVTVRETPKPGEEAAHAQLEAKYTSTLDAGNASQYYLGMGGITGAQQTVFLTGYSSLEEMSEVHDADDAALGEKLDSLDTDHGRTLAGVDTAIWRLRPDLSNPDAVNLAKMRFMEMIHIHLKLGHGTEFAEVNRHIKEGWMKADPNFHYTIYQQIFGSATDDSYLVVIAMKSLADLDKHHSLVAAFQKSLGEDVRKRTLEVEGADYNSTESNLFVFTPSISRLPESGTKDDLAFWKPKASLTAPAEKPATAK